MGIEEIFMFYYAVMLLIWYWLAYFSDANANNKSSMQFAQDRLFQIVKLKPPVEQKRATVSPMYEESEEIEPARQRCSRAN